MNSYTIFKYKIDIVDEQIIELPRDSNVLCVQLQNDIPHIWAIINEKDQNIDKKKFLLFGTGHNLPDTINENYKYIGTFQLREGSLVFHLFQELK